MRRPNFPPACSGPFVNDEYSDVIFAVYALEAHGMPPRELTREAETLRQRLLHVPGVKKVNIQGERPERIFVEFSYARLANLGVGPTDIFDALQRQNAVTPAGSIDTNGPQVFMRLDGAFDDLQKIRDTPIAAGGRTLRLGGHRRGQTRLRRSGDLPDPPRWRAALRTRRRDAGRLERIGSGPGAERGREADRARHCPRVCGFTKVVDQAVNIQEAVGEFMLKFFVALAVIMIVSLISLGWRVGIVVAAAVPLTLAGGIRRHAPHRPRLRSDHAGRARDRLGLLVDDAIIAIEMMVVKLEEGFDRVKAAAYAWSHTAAPMLVGDTGHDHRLHARGFRPIDRGRVRGQHFLDRGLCADRLLAGGRRLHAVSRCQAAARHQARPWRPCRDLFNTALPASASAHLLGRRPSSSRSLAWWSRVFLLAGLGMGFVKRQFFPSSDRPEVLVEVQMPEGTSIEATSGRRHQSRSNGCASNPRPRS